jgi:hypothetical protein
MKSCKINNDEETGMRSVILAGIVCLGLVAPAGAQTAVPETELRELVEAAKATAKATRESVDYARVTPDILTQILAKLDKIEDKLDKVENAIKREAAPRRTAR